jgi:Ca2+/Na+ antiporter
VTPNARVGLLGVIAVAWFVLAAVNLARVHVAVGLAYAACGAVVTVLTLRLSRGRRSR